MGSLHRLQRDEELVKMHWIRGETLGRGGFAFVSKGTTRQDGSNIPLIIAVKSSKSSHSNSLLKEKKLLDRFNHCPFIIRCFGDETTLEDGQELYNIFLEYASGGCLADIVKSCGGKGLSEPVVKHHTRSILMALSHMHALGYVHCDVKPHNVLMVKEGDEKTSVNTFGEETAKLADLGSAINMLGGDDEDDGGFRGTVLYAAPESIANQTYVPQSDVWSLGCTVLFMLTGKSPWKFDNHRTTAADVMMTIGCSDQIPEIPSTKKISKEAVDFLKQCFVKDPRSRCTADMLLDHPFVRARNASPHAAKCSSHHHHHLTSRLSQRISSLVPSCFHVVDSAAVRPV